jgi:hypothetical protein
MVGSPLLWVAALDVRLLERCTRGGAVADYPKGQSLGHDIAVRLQLTMGPM